MSGVGSVMVILALAALGCEMGADDRRIRASYEEFTGRLQQLSADQDGDGRLDQWTYLDGNRPLRGEADADGDGRIDRWEYFDREARLTHVGASTQGDGIEDSWDWVAGDGGESRRDVSRGRDRHVDRREFRRGDELVRAEEDTNHDGRTDRWDRYTLNVIREAAFDTTFAQGRPNYRLLYDEKGQFIAVEADLDADGRFERLSGEAAAAARAGVKR